MLFTAFQSTPSAWRETPVRRQGSLLEDISIHSLRMEGDTTLDSFSNHLSISIHSLRMEGDFFTFWNQSSNTHFNPLPPHGGRPSLIRELSSRIDISIHSLHTEGDDKKSIIQSECKNFNPLPPHGGRHLWNCLDDAHEHFNPLPPHGGRPAILILVRKCQPYFNPLPPHGGRPVKSLA